MVTFKVALAEPPEFAAPTVTLLVPAVVGVPAMTPVLELMESPAGSPNAVKDVGLFVAVIW
jgi:hypothetical protein